ncbi:hypothetical protein [Rhodococcus qingshengii]|uniref:hypothetical protein n=1 Tax=Rhodococcus qingshengii TaxID=334542 RepID=UPI001AE0AC9B|nr:hypothetical protein [Rhodococcus qingshengii]MCQ4148674.1 hypothetical protein [Rhodococcus qingshengii]
MSTHADPNKAYVWQDGDAFRAPAGTGIPVDPFGVSVVTGTSPGVTWDAFGGIEAGFEQNPSQDTKELPIWNYKKSAYKIARGPRSDRLKLKPVDYSKATVTTFLQGGEIIETATGSGIFKYVIGDSEDFALLLRLEDEDDVQALYCERVTLFAPPPRSLGGDKIDGFELELLALAPVYPLSNTNPLAP